LGLMATTPLPSKNNGCLSDTRHLKKHFLIGQTVSLVITQGLGGFFLGWSMGSKV
jgi:hypothetical protein